MFVFKKRGEIPFLPKNEKGKENSVLFNFLGPFPHTSVVDWRLMQPYRYFSSM